MHEMYARRRFVAVNHRDFIHTVMMLEFPDLSLDGRKLIRLWAWVLFHSSTHQSFQRIPAHTAILHFWYCQLAYHMRVGRPSSVYHLFGAVQSKLWKPGIALPRDLRPSTRPAPSKVKCEEAAYAYFCHLTLRPPSFMSTDAFSHLCRTLQAGISPRTLSPVMLYMLMIYAVKHDYVRILIELDRMGACTRDYQDLKIIEWLTQKDEDVAHMRYCDRPKITRYLLRSMVFTRPCGLLRVSPLRECELDELWDCIQ